MVDGVGKVEVPAHLGCHDGGGRGGSAGDVGAHGPEPKHVGDVVNLLDLPIGIKVAVAAPDNAIGRLDLLLGGEGTRVAVVVLSSLIFSVVLGARSSTRGDDSGACNRGNNHSRGSNNLNRLGLCLDGGDRGGEGGSGWQDVPISDCVGEVHVVLHHGGDDGGWSGVGLDGGDWLGNNRGGGGGGRSGLCGHDGGGSGGGLIWDDVNGEVGGGDAEAEGVGDVLNSLNLA